MPQNEPQGATGGGEPYTLSGRAAYRGTGREMGRGDAPEPPVEQMGAMGLNDQNFSGQQVVRRRPRYSEPVYREPGDSKIGTVNTCTK